MNNRRAVVTVSAVGTVLVTVYAAFAALQILVLNPLAAMPGKTLPQIHADMAAFGESPGTGLALVVVGTGVSLAVLIFALLAPRKDATVTAALLAYLTMLVLGTPAYFVASFGPGMSLADTYGISGADYSEGANALYLTSGLALLGLVALAVARMATRSAPSPAAE